MSKSENQRPPRKRSSRIVVSLLIVLMVVGMGPLITVVWQLVASNREALKTSHRENQLQLANSLSYEIGLHLDASRNAVRQIATGLAQSNRKVSGQSFRDLASIYVDQSTLIYAFRDIEQRSHTYAVEALPEGLDAIMLNLIDQSNQLLAQGEEAKPLESKPNRLDDLDQRVIVLRSEPVFRSGKLIGALSAIIDVKGIWESMVNHHRSPHAIVVIDPDGEPIFSTDPEWLVPGNGLIRSEIVGRFLDSEGRSTETTLFNVDHRGESQLYLGSYARTEEAWGLLVVAPEDQVYLPVQRMIRNTWMVASVALFCAILIAIFFAGTLSRPIERLTAASRAFASGDFSSRVEVRSRNEIGELADTFNGMAEDIQRYISDIRKASAENHELFLGTIKALAQAIDAKDPYTRGHSARVNKYSVVLAHYLKLDKHQIRDIHISSLLHDVGKIGIDDGILRKPGRLTEEEFEIMKTHPVLGANIMAPIKSMARVLPGLRWHHERMNGSGYPDGLQGEQIPLMARIIAVADSFDAMTTNRPYQRPMPFAASAARINELSGTHFDEKIVDAFNQAFAAGEFANEEEEQKKLQIKNAQAG